MLLVDRVVSMVKDTSIHAVKAVTMNEPFFQGHFPGRPIMPGVLIVEALAQAGGILAVESPGLGGSGSEEHPAELQALIRTPTALFSFEKKNTLNWHPPTPT